MPRTPLKILIFDIETAPSIAYFWSPFKTTISPSQIVQNWYVMSWAAKWVGDPANKVMYMDQSRSKDQANDKKILERLKALIEEADVVVAHNGIKFDRKKINSRFLYHGIKPPAPVKMVDTRQVAKDKFGFTFNSLEHLSDHLCKKYKKLKHQKYPGMDLWRECMGGNKDAWREMRKYNIHDVLALEELYELFSPWIPETYLIHMDEIRCKCGSDDIHKRGFARTTTGKYQRYQCQSCGHWSRDTRRVRNSCRTGVAR